MKKPWYYTQINKGKEIKAYIEKIILELDITTCKDQISVLQRIGFFKRDFQNLISIKEHILSIKAQLIDVERTLKEDELTALVDSPTPTFFENIVMAVKIAQAEAIQNNVAKSIALCDISFALVKAKDITWATQVAHTIPDNATKRIALCDISLALVKAKDITWAMQVAHTIPDKACLNNTLVEMIDILREADDIPAAIKMANTLPSHITRSYSLARICTTLAETGDVSKAREIANTITHPDAQQLASSAIAKYEHTTHCLIQ